MSKRKRIKAEEKIRIAKACASGVIGLNAAADQLGVHQSVVDDWVRLYQTEGIASLLPRKENRRYDPVVKEMAVKDYLSGRGSLREICKIYKTFQNDYDEKAYCKEYLYSYADCPKYKLLFEIYKGNPPAPYNN